MTRITNNTERSLMKLAQVFNITIKKGWKKNLAEKLEIKRVLLSTWINRDKISKPGLVEIEKKGYPRADWFITEQVSAVSAIAAIESRVAVEEPPGAITRGDITRQFKNKDVALDINTLLLKIEALDPVGLHHIRSDLEGQLKVLRRMKNHGMRSGYLKGATGIIHTSG